MRTAENLTRKMIDNNIIKEADKNIYQYGLINFFFFMINITTAILIGALFGKLSIIFIFLLFFMSLRSFTGGFHLGSKLLCYFGSNLIMLIPIFGQRFFYQFTSNISRTAALIIILSVIFYLSPVEGRNREYDDAELKQFRKVSRVILMIQVIMYAFFVYWGMPDFAYTVFTSFLVVAVLLLLGKLDLKIKGI